MQTNSIKAGFYSSDITPFYNTKNNMMNNIGRTQGVNTPFSMTAGVFLNHERCIALVGADMIVLERSLVEFAEAELKKIMPLDALIVGASHTHANPNTLDWLGEHLSDADIMAMEDIRPEIRELIKRDMGRVQPEYKTLLRYRLVDAVWNAWQRCQPVRLVNGTAEVDNVAFNRRQKMKNGLTVSHGGKGNPDVLDYAGPVDTELVALGAVNSDGKMIGAVVNFACHATVSSEKKFSADWPYYMRATVKRNINPEMEVVFFNGCCGDVTQIDNLDPTPEQRTERRAMVLGERVGFGAVEALRAPESEEFTNLFFKRVSLSLGYREISDERYQKVLAEVNNKYDITKDAWLIGYYDRDTVLLVNKARTKPTFNCELNCVQIGNLLLLTTPGEVFAQMSLDLKEANSQFAYVMVTELTNGYAGYIPVKSAFGPTGGGYEPRFAGGSFLEKDAFELIRDKLVAVGAEFKPERQPPALPPPGKPWIAYKPEEL